MFHEESFFRNHFVNVVRWRRDNLARALRIELSSDEVKKTIFRVFEIFSHNLKEQKQSKVLRIG